MSTFGVIGARPLIKPPFVELEWLQGDGSSGIVIPYRYADGGVIEVEYYRGSQSTEIVFGTKRTENTAQILTMKHSRNSDKMSRQQAVYSWMNNQNSEVYVYSAWFSNNDPNKQLTTKFSLKMDLDTPANTFWNGVTGIVETNASKPTNYSRVGLFGISQPNSDAMFSYSTVKIHSFKITKNGIPIYDLVPVRKGGIGYMYNRVTDSFMEKIGTGTFILGPDKVGGGGNQCIELSESAFYAYSSDSFWKEVA